MPLATATPTPPTLYDIPLEVLEHDMPEQGVPEHDLPEPSLPFPPLAAKPRLLRVGTLVLAGWAISLVLLAGLGWGSVRWRDSVMRVWPPSERLYAALGLAPDQTAQ